MIIDGKRVPSGQRFDCDVCIVGSGAAGITAALELAGGDVTVVMVESGGAKRPGASQNLYRGTVNDLHRHLAPDKDRFRGLGGTTGVWGGRCMPFDAIDFSKRHHVPNSGWPISWDQLEAYYSRAHVYCECGAFAYQVESALGAANTEMISGFHDSAITTRSIERWSPPTRFGRRYYRELEKSQAVRVLVNTTAVELATTTDGRRVERVRAKTLAGNEVEIVPRWTVLAGGALEVTRLLLASNKVQSEGIGNAHDWLGRCYMSHIQGIVSRITLHEDRKVVFGYETDSDEVYCRRRLWPGADTQVRENLLNTYLLLDRPLIGRPEHGNALLSLSFLAKSVGRNRNADFSARGKWGLYLAHAKNVLTGASGLVTQLPAFGRKRFLHSRRIPSILVRPRVNEYSLYFHAEQAPNPASRVSLCRQRDALGMPQIAIDYRITELDLTSVHRLHLLVDHELRRQACGYLSFERPDPLGHIAESAAVPGHHMGTTRMSDTPSGGVVDAECRVHEVDNLFVASSSVFATGSQAHPTLTIVALAIRVADRIRRLMERPTPELQHAE